MVLDKAFVQKLEHVIHRNNTLDRVHAPDTGNVNNLSVPELRNFVYYLKE